MQEFFWRWWQIRKQLMTKNNCSHSRLFRYFFARTFCDKVNELFFSFLLWFHFFWRNKINWEIYLFSRFLFKVVPGVSIDLIASWKIDFVLENLIYIKYKSNRKFSGIRWLHRILPLHEMFDLLVIKNHKFRLLNDQNV